jgi:hypothetical protein
MLINTRKETASHVINMQQTSNYSVISVDDVGGYMVNRLNVVS